MSRFQRLESEMDKFGNRISKQLNLLSSRIAFAKSRASVLPSLSCESQLARSICSPKELAATKQGAVYVSASGNGSSDEDLLVLLQSQIADLLAERERIISKSAKDLAAAKHQIDSLRNINSELRKSASQGQSEVSQQVSTLELALEQERKVFIIEISEKNVQFLNMIQLSRNIQAALSTAKEDLASTTSKLHQANNQHQRDIYRLMDRHRNDVKELRAQIKELEDRLNQNPVNVPDSRHSCQPAQLSNENQLFGPSRAGALENSKLTGFGASRSDFIDLAEDPSRNDRSMVPRTTSASRSTPERNSKEGFHKRTEAKIDDPVRSDKRQSGLAAQAEIPNSHLQTAPLYIPFVFPQQYGYPWMMQPSGPPYVTAPATRGDIAPGIESNSDIKVAGKAKGSNLEDTRRASRPGQSALESVKRRDSKEELLFTLQKLKELHELSEQLLK
ncbi:hypothetical protein BJ742DRAFT_265226 [Cladochytrium replicatum]|nr:hypothetical protein BJ742DRAFT_265226 [Cladochytrium replicatum]